MILKRCKGLAVLIAFSQDNVMSAALYDTCS